MTDRIEQAQRAFATYAVERELGSGGMATVYLAHQFAPRAGCGLTRWCVGQRLSSDHQVVRLCTHCVESLQRDH